MIYPHMLKSLFLRLLVPYLLLLSACGHSSVLQKLVDSPTAQLPYCNASDPIVTGQLPPVLEGLNLTPDKTHAILLEEGASALVARGWLAENAVQSLDLQYFIFSSDNVGILSTDTLLLAAERGVKVRLIVDDTLSHGDPDLLQALALHPNAEVRIYNPTLKVGVSQWRQAKNVVTNFRGVNQRMHNKLFIADSKVAITGGRNVSSEYFDLDGHANFRDRDILLIHGAVEETQKSFDSFWESSLSVPITKLMGERPDVPVGEAWRVLHEYSCNPQNFYPAIRKRINRLPASFAKQREEGLLHTLDDVHFVWDPPGKNESDGMWDGSDTTTTLIELVQRAKKSIVIQTPYLVTTEVSQKVFKEATDRGVRIRILTNSLSATDNVMAFSGYKRSRKALLKSGVEIFELKPDPEIQAAIMNGPLRFRMTTELAVHAKSMVIDDEIAVVGSFNLDPRSANLNTEVLAVLHSEPLSRYLKHQMTREMSPDNAWETTLDSNPDKNAPWGRRFNLFWARLVPMSVL